MQRKDAPRALDVLERQPRPAAIELTLHLLPRITRLEVGMDDDVRHAD